METIIEHIKKISGLHNELIELSEENYTALKNNDFEKIRDLEIRSSLLEDKKVKLTDSLINLIKLKAEELNVDTPSISSLVPHIDSDELRAELLEAVEEMENKIEQLRSILLRNIQFAKLIMEYKNEQIEMVIDIAEREGFNSRSSLIIEQEI